MLLALTTTRTSATNLQDYFHAAGKQANAETAVKAAITQSHRPCQHSLDESKPFDRYSGSDVDLLHVLEVRIALQTFMQFDRTSHVVDCRFDMLNFHFCPPSTPCGGGDLPSIWHSAAQLRGSCTSCKTRALVGSMILHWR